MLTTGTAARAIQHVGAEAVLERWKAARGWRALPGTDEQTSLAELLSTSQDWTSVGADFERVAAVVNAFPEVAHNYERKHVYNLWFVLATACGADTGRVISLIEEGAGYPVLQLPREAEYFVELKLVA